MARSGRSAVAHKRNAAFLAGEEKLRSAPGVTEPCRIFIPVGPSDHPDVVRIGRIGHRFRGCLKWRYGYCRHRGFSCYGRLGGRRNGGQRRCVFRTALLSAPAEQHTANQNRKMNYSLSHVLPPRFCSFNHTQLCGFRQPEVCGGLTVPAARARRNLSAVRNPLRLT